MAVRLQAGLVWPAFDTTVNGWSMDKPVERIRVLGTSPETDETGIRKVLGQYGEILDCQKGYISKRLPGCTNGIWTVKLLLKAGMSLPPFLIMKDEGEVWQLATGEASVCWKCGKAGHIGDKCRQAVNILAESLASPAVGDQPSWAHVVKGGVSVAPPPPPPPPPVIPNPQLFRNPFKATAEILVTAKAALKQVAKAAEAPPRVPLQVQAVANVDKDALEHAYALVNPPSPAMEVSVGDVEIENVSMQGNTSSGDAQIPQFKKAKFVGDLVSVDEVLSTSPDLHHKQPKSRQQQQKNDDSEDLNESESTGESCDKEVPKHSNLYGVKFMMWFEIGIEGKDPMDNEEDDWGGKLEFGFNETTFPTDVDDYFVMFEDQCTQSHICAGRVSGVLSHIRKNVIDPPDYDPRNIVDLLDKYQDGHISDSGWREVDPEEWYLQT